MKKYIFDESNKQVAAFKEMSVADLMNVFKVTSVVNNGDHFVIRVTSK